MKVSNPTNNDDVSVEQAVLKLKQALSMLDLLGLAVAAASVQLAIELCEAHISGGEVPHRDRASSQS